MKITLNEDQKKQYKKIIKVWNSGEPVCIDGSVMGTGKTVVACKLSKNFDQILAITPATIVPNWHDETNKYGVKLTILSYETLTSSKNQTPKHPFLTREDIDGEIIFKVTEKFKELVKKGICLVADEFHRIKKKNSRYFAFKALCDYICETKDIYNSKILLLSGSPYCEIEHPCNILQMINIIKSDLIFKFDKHDNRILLTGLEELINYCKNIDEDDTENILMKYSINNKNVYEIAFELYVKIVQKKIVCAMPSPKLDAKLYCYNAYFNMEESAAKKLKQSIDNLKSAVGNKNKILKNDIAITTALRYKQNDKISIYERISKIILKMDSTNKLCIFLDFDEAIFDVYDRLKNYNPHLITGKIDKNDRNDIIKKFQQDNCECRLLILNTAIGCEGINLDDVHGNFKRYVLVEPSFYIIRMHQLMRRFLRVNTKSDTIIYCVYAVCGSFETNIINSTARKSIVMKETLEAQVSEGILFPADYPQVEEKDFLNDSFEMLPVEKIVAEETKKNTSSKKSFVKNHKFSNMLLQSNIVNDSFGF